STPHAGHLPRPRRTTPHGRSRVARPTQPVGQGSAQAQGDSDRLRPLGRGPAHDWGHDQGPAGVRLLRLPRRYYEVTYPSPGAPEPATKVRCLLKDLTPTADDPFRGLDHGAYVPLLAMYPEADVPVLQISLPSEDPRVLVEVGKRLAPLRDEGVLILGSGFLTHSFEAIRM